MVRAGLTAERLTRAGAELADKVGFDQVTVSALARRFDVKVASLYSHVSFSAVDDRACSSSPSMGSTVQAASSAA
ncbi:TetR family transcriptional regulator [Streptosporangium amethystogenes subsp. fukuiense]